MNKNRPRQECYMCGEYTDRTTEDQLELYGQVVCPDCYDTHSLVAVTHREVTDALNKAHADIILNLESDPETLQMRINVYEAIAQTGNVLIQARVEYEESAREVS